MAIILKKGANMSLTQAVPSLKNIKIGLGWDIRETEGEHFDLDVEVFLLDSTGKVSAEEDFIFYNQTSCCNRAVQHLGDNKTGFGEGDDEVILLNLEKLPALVEKIAICVTIHEAEARNQNFGMVSSAYIRCINQINNEEIAHYDLSEDAALERSMIFGEIYRYATEWKFRAVGQGFLGGLTELVEYFGLEVASSSV